MEMNQTCKVCGEPAAGFHFGAFTCEGCKSFFGRSYNNTNSINECKNNNSCTINKKNRTACKSCRLQKCLSVGMSKSGSRYGRRSNWFKIHCLLQEQQQNGNIMGLLGGVPGSPANLAAMGLGPQMQMNGSPPLQLGVGGGGAGAASAMSRLDGGGGGAGGPQYSHPAYAAAAAAAAHNAAMHGRHPHPPPSACSNKELMMMGLAAADTSDSSNATFKHPLSTSPSVSSPDSHKSDSSIEVGDRRQITMRHSLPAGMATAQSLAPPPSLVATGQPPVSMANYAKDATALLSMGFAGMPMPAQGFIPPATMMFPGYHPAMYQGLLKPVMDAHLHQQMHMQHLQHQQHLQQDQQHQQHQQHMHHLQHMASVASAADAQANIEPNQPANVSAAALLGAANAAVAEGNDERAQLLFYQFQRQQLAEAFNHNHSAALAAAASAAAASNYNNNPNISLANGNASPPESPQSVDSVVKSSPAEDREKDEYVKIEENNNHEKCNDQRQRRMGSEEAISADEEQELVVSCTPPPPPRTSTPSDTHHSPQPAEPQSSIPTVPASSSAAATSIPVNTVPQLPPAPSTRQPPLLLDFRPLQINVTACVDLPIDLSMNSKSSTASSTRSMLSTTSSLATMSPRSTSNSSGESAETPRPQQKGRSATRSPQPKPDFADMQQDIKRIRLETGIPLDLTAKV